MENLQKLTAARPDSIRKICKRAFDVFASSCAILILLPVYAVLASIILIVDGRPILFRQERPGLDGKPFRILKFRTMRNSTEGLQDSERLTRTGRLLRSFSLDELPEFWNVFIGDMSLVGPRPLLMSYIPRYTSRQALRHSVRPGITGWAQVNGRNQLDWSDRFELDLWYIDNANFWLDVKILLSTALKVIFREGISASGTVTMHEFQGTETMKIEMSSAEISEADISAVVEVMRSGRLALGPKTMEFEQRMARYVGVKHAIAVSSGTAALHLIVKALGLGPGDEVLVPSFTFAASVNAILYEGAVPVFVDLREDNFNLDHHDLVRKITSRTKAIMAVDVFGHPVDWDEIQTIADEHHLKIIDDCCEALGAEYKGKKIGSFGDAGAFAFYPNKQITTGEGGMIVTNNDEIARLARSYRNQGRDEMGQWLEHPRMGYNYRLDEMSAALGASQMARLDQIVDKRAAVAATYTKKLSGLSGVRVPQILSDVKMSWFVYVITLDVGISAEQVIQGLADFQIPSRAYFSPIHLQPYLTTPQTVGTSALLPKTKRVTGRTIALPFHNNFSEREVDHVVTKLSAVLDDIRSQQKKAV